MPEMAVLIYLKIQVFLRKSLFIIFEIDWRSGDGHSVQMQHAYCTVSWGTKELKFLSVHMRSMYWLFYDIVMTITKQINLMDFFTMFFQFSAKLICVWQNVCKRSETEAFVKITRLTYWRACIWLRHRTDSQPMYMSAIWCARIIVIVVTVAYI